jgi:hypothetical protein
MNANCRIGIRSEDLKNTVEKTLGGSIFVLSSPRLIIPAVIFGLATFSSHFQNSIFNFEVKAHLFIIINWWCICQIYVDLYNINFCEEIS